MRSMCPLTGYRSIRPIHGSYRDYEHPAYYMFKLFTRLPYLRISVNKGRGDFSSGGVRAIGSAPPERHLSVVIYWLTPIETAAWLHRRSPETRTRTVQFLKLLPPAYWARDRYTVALVISSAISSTTGRFTLPYRAYRPTVIFHGLQHTRLR